MMQLDWSNVGLFAGIKDSIVDCRISSSRKHHPTNIAEIGNRDRTTVYGRMFSGYEGAKRNGR